MQLKISSKHLQINQAQSKIIATITIATVITVFCLVSSKALLGQAMYQRRVINAREVAVTQLNKNVEQASALETNYQQVFLGTGPSNIIGGRNTNDLKAIPPDGNNATIVLDALPTKYDFPALVTSLSSILDSSNIQTPNIGGSDQTSQTASAASSASQAVPIQITVSGTGSYVNVQQLVKDFERSIRPFDITKLSLSGGSSALQVSLQLTTYYQPAKALNIGSKVVK